MDHEEVNVVTLKGQPGNQVKNLKKELKGRRTRWSPGNKLKVQTEHGQQDWKEEMSRRDTEER